MLLKTDVGEHNTTSVLVKTDKKTMLRSTKYWIFRKTNVVNQT